LLSAKPRDFGHNPPGDIDIWKKWVFSQVELHVFSLNLRKVWSLGSKSSSKQRGADTQQVPPPLRAIDSAPFVRRLDGVH
jgi:hypothetical protein